MRALIFWFLVFASSFTSFFIPFLGMTCYLGIAHTQLAGFLWGGQADNFGVLLGGSIILGYFTFSLRLSPPKVRGMIFMLLLWIWLALSAFLAYDRGYSIPKLEEYSKIFLISLLLAALLNSERRVKTVLTVIAASLGFLGARGTAIFIATAGQARLQGPGALIGDENEFALAMNMGITMLVFLARGETNRRLRILYRCLGASCALTVIGTHSRSGLLGLVTVGLMIVVLSRHKILGFAGVAVASLLLVLALPDAAVERYKTMENAATADESFMGRLESWETARRMVNANPFFGVGPKNFVPVYPQFANYFPRAPHNAYIALAAESGLPACAFYVLMLGSTMISMHLVRRRLRHDEASTSLCVYALVVQTALIATLLPNLFINRQDYDLIYHLVAIGAAITFLGRKRMREWSAETKQQALIAAGVERALQPVLDAISWG